MKHMKYMKYITLITVILASSNAVIASAFHDYAESFLWLWLAWQMIDIHKRDTAWADFERLSVEAVASGRDTIQFDFSRLK